MRMKKIIQIAQKRASQIYAIFIYAFKHFNVWRDKIL